LNKIFFALFLFCQTLSAVEVEGLYETEVLADSRSVSDRNKAIRHALQIVLNRVVIARDHNHPLLKTALEAAPLYVREFQFSLGTNNGARNRQNRLLRVRFDEHMLQTLFKDGGVGLWNEIRPETLLWLIVEKNGQRRFYQADNMPEVEFALTRAARLTGLPLIFPLLDMEEQRFLTPNDVLSADPRLLLDVSSRYDVVSILTGRLHQSGQCWQGEWALYFNQKIHQWGQDNCQTLEYTALAGLQHVYSVLSNYYGVKQTGAKHLLQ